jgi:hypothetical protein
MGDSFPPNRPLSGLQPKTQKIFLEPTTGIEPVSLFLTKEALYQLSYVGAIFLAYFPYGLE